MSRPSLRAGSGLGDERQPLCLAVGGARPGRTGIGASATPGPGARARSRGGRGGRSRAVLRRSRWRRRQRRLAARRRRGLRIVRWGIGSFWILYPVSEVPLGICGFCSVEGRLRQQDRRPQWRRGKRRTAAAPWGGLNQQVPPAPQPPDARRGRGAGLVPSPTHRVLGPGETLGCSTGCPTQRDPQTVAEGVSPTFVLWRNAVWLCPVPRSRRGTHLGRAPARPAGIAGGAVGSRGVLCTPVP